MLEKSKKISFFHLALKKGFQRMCVTLDKLNKKFEFQMRFNVYLLDDGWLQIKRHLKVSNVSHSLASSWN